MDLPARLTVHGYGFVMDGGSIALDAKDGRGRKHEILLAQRVVPNSGGSYIPGRLYFDGTVVEMRSAHEAKLLSLLRFSVDPPLERELPVPTFAVNLLDTVRAFVVRVVQFVESEEYLRFQDGVKEQEKRHGESLAKFERYLAARRRR